jgi:hypothetical protein
MNRSIGGCFAEPPCWSRILISYRKLSRGLTMLSECASGCYAALQKAGEMTVNPLLRGQNAQRERDKAMLQQEGSTVD